jgi:hypothetical protein
MVPQWLPCATVISVHPTPAGLEKRVSEEARRDCSLVPQPAGERAVEKGDGRSMVKMFVKPGLAA